MASVASHSAFVEGNVFCCSRRDPVTLHSVIVEGMVSFVHVEIFKVSIFFEMNSLLAT